MKHHGIDLQIDPIAAEHSLFCRPTQITQALLNLLDNAFDAVKQSALKKISIKLVIEPQRIGLSVIDSGPGIAPELASELFTPFFSTKGFSNSGLGLSTTKAIVDDHNGIIYLDKTHPDTCFTLLLPKIT